MISSNVRQLSSLRMGSRSSKPTWLSVATRMRIVSAAELSARPLLGGDHLRDRSEPEAGGIVEAGEAAPPDWSGRPDTDAFG